MLLDTLGTVFTSILSGGVTGLLGVVAQRYADYKNRQVDVQLEQMRGDFELQKREADARILAQEWAARTQVAQVEATGASDIAASQAFAKSFETDPLRYTESGMPLSRWQRWAFVSLDWVRGMVRPALVIYLAILTTLIYWQAQRLLDGAPPDAETAHRLVQTIVDQVLYLTTTCVCWYFGVRPTKK